MKRVLWALIAGLALGGGGQAAAEPASEPARSSQTLLQAKWVVPDATAAAAEAVEWVRGKGGLAVMTSERHVSMKLPAALAQELFHRYAGTPAPSEAVSGSLWVTVSLEFVSTP